MGKGKTASEVKAAIEATSGVLRLAPAWVPRAFLVPGRRLRLNPKDLYVLGAERGGIDERWLASTVRADNGPLTAPEEGLSHIVWEGGRILLKDAIEACGEELLGGPVMNVYGGWKVLAKFFDNMDPIPHHLHPSDKFARNVGLEGKPEAYFFPAQLNTIENTFPYTFFGLKPGTTREDVRECLVRWDEGDNRILDLSRSYRLRPGTGWLIPAGILHAPGTLLTYEVQWASDVYAMYQSMVKGKAISKDLLLKDVPKDKHEDLDYLLDMIDWENNIDTRFEERYYLEPIPVADTTSQGYKDEWIVYGKIDGCDKFSAKQVTVAPGAEATIKDNGAYGLVVVQGRGTIEGLRAEAPLLINYGDMTEDEFFVTSARAAEGVTLRNEGSEPFVTLRHFGPDTNPHAPEVGASRYA